MKNWIDKFYYSFPIQLFVLHLRSNQLLLIIWVLLILFITGVIGSHYGMKYVFLDPEYMGQVNLLSFFIMGMTYGGFFITWNLTSYLLSAEQFPFLATLHRPFKKWRLNNFIIPVAFLLIFLVSILRFQVVFELWSIGDTLLKCLSFAIGALIVIKLVELYLRYTNKDIDNYVKKQRKAPPNLIKSVAPGRREPNLDMLKSKNKVRNVKTYLTEKYRLRLVRSIAHYDPNLLMNIFKQNHTNVLIIQLFSVVILILFGILIDYPWFRLPAGASLFILASILVAISGAITYWFKDWKLTVLVFLLLTMNWITGQQKFNYNNKAYGLNFNTTRADYNIDALNKIIDPEIVNADKENTLQILNNWKANHKEEKPKMVLTCVSGGGLKASTWAVKVIETADKALDRELLEHTVLFSGSSGGLIGTAYLRECYYEEKIGKIDNMYNKNHIEHISKDLLNSIAFMLVSNDLFLPWLEFEKGGYRYRKDRGYIFEKQLNENTGYVMDKTLSDYREPELKAKIPMMMITPSIVNDGRRMVISSQPVSYMMVSPIGVENEESVEIDAVDFGRLFEEQNSQNLSFVTALRMNATYPFILPNVHLPSKPEIEVMDAGFSDNYGVKSAVRFVHVFSDWIKENTSGVALVLITGRDRSDDINQSESKGIISNLLHPLGLAGKMMRLQEFDHDTNLGFTYDLLGEDMFDVIRFKYKPSEHNEEASMTFHLTENEKRDIMSAIDEEENQESLKRLQELFAPSKSD